MSADGPAPHRLAETRRLHALAEHAAAVVAVADAAGGFASENPAWAAFTGQAATAWAGDGWLAMVHDDDRAAAALGWRAAVASGRPATLRFRLRRHDGAWRTAAARGAPVLDGGRAIEWVLLVSDVTEAERDLATFERRSSHLQFLDQLGQATRSLTEASEVMAVSARLLAQHLGASRCAYADVEADNDRFTIRSDWAEPGLASSAGVYSLDLFGPRAAGNLRQGQTLVVRDVRGELVSEGGADMFLAIGIQAIVTAPLVKGDRLVAMMAVHQHVPRDWTADEIALVEAVVDRCWAHVERVRDAAALREKDRQKDEFVAQLAHELRNPLAPISYAAALMRMSESPVQLARMREIVERQVGHMARLIDDLLDISRVNRGHIELKREVVALQPLLQQAVEVSRPAMESAGHALEVDVAAGELWLDADPARVVQVVGNLLHNAAKYTRDGGRIRLSARRDGEHAVIEVVDNGIGIPAEDQAQLFQMFRQLPHTAGRAKGGLGIGLALVRRLVEMHGGEVTVRSEGLDRGSTFRVALPLVAAPGTAATADAALHGGHAPHAPMRDPLGLDVLVVEDNADGRESLVLLLREAGCRVRSAPDGSRGLTLALETEPQVVLLDIGLPGLDGLDVARRLREDARGRRMHLVALTGWGAETDRARTAGVGFDAHLTKPVDAATLLRHLAKVPKNRG